MNKSVGIITIAKVNNYGADLQAFATQHVVKQMGYNVEIIDYLFYKHPRHKRTNGAKPLFPFSMYKRIVEWLYPKVNRYKQMLLPKATLIRRTMRFNTFLKENTKFSKEYRTAEDLSNDIMNYDVYVVGSDQVWNPNNYTSLDPYFLKFAPKDKRRVSYASSFGVSTLPEYTRDYYRDALLGLDAVSVREESAVKIVEDVSGVKAKWVLDPTLLLTREEWLMISKRVERIPGKYVLIYEITPCSFLKEIAQSVANSLNCRIVRINREPIRQEKEEEVVNVMDAGPAEFLWLFNNASFVVTNSFHGTCFSITMRKDFFVVTPKRKQNNSRQRDLLDLVGLKDRIIMEGAPIPPIDSFSIDYTPVIPRLDTARESSLSYLKKAIDG